MKLVNRSVWEYYSETMPNLCKLDAHCVQSFILSRVHRGISEDGIKSLEYWEHPFWNYVAERVDGGHNRRCFAFDAVDSGTHCSLCGWFWFEVKQLKRDSNGLPQMTSIVLRETSSCMSSTWLWALSDSRSSSDMKRPLVSFIICRKSLRMRKWNEGVISLRRSIHWWPLAVRRPLPSHG